jgi:hypothetical protein
MWMRTTVALTTVLAFGCASTGMANAHRYKHRHHTHVVQYAPQPPEPAPYYGGRLVLHPALNFACMAPYQSTRALPCDHPVWVYGSPCEVDLGLGRSRPCD